MKTSLVLLATALLLAASSAFAEEPPKATADPLHHALVQEKVGFYAVYLPPDYHREENREKRWPLCVILHGSGATETGHGALANTFGREGVIYVAPRAPHAAGELFREGRPGYTAWPDYPEGWGRWDSEGFPTEEIERLGTTRIYTDWIAKCIDDVRERYRADDQRVVVVGHSQGAAFAHQLALHRPELVRAYFAYAGYYSDTTGDEVAALTLGKHGILPVLLHCEADEVVKAEETRGLAAYLAEREVEHQVTIHPGGSHGFTSKVSRAAQEFVARLCRQEELAPLLGELHVMEVVPGSQAEAAGLRPGDVITAYAGTKMSCLDDLIAATKAVSEETGEIEIRWRRGKEEHRATLRPGRLGVMLADR